MDFEALRLLDEEGPHSLISLHEVNSEERVSRLDGQASSVRDPTHFGAATSLSDETEYKETSSVFVPLSPNTSVETIDQARNTVLLRNKGTLLNDYDKDILAMAFPDLFPYGFGHPGTGRRVPVSFEECCRYYLRLGNKSFAQNTAFPLVAFNLISKMRVALSTVIRAKINPASFSQLATVTRQELVEALSRQKQRRENALAGRFHPVVTSSADKLLDSVRVSQKHMWGSAGERLVYRRRAFSMDVFIKSAAVFVTITPSDVGTLAISVLSGIHCLDQVQEMDGESVPSHGQRLRIAGCNPIACAEYFECVCEAFFNSMVRFDKSSGLPHCGGGLFGYAKGYIGVTESQGSGTLHMHGVVYVAGLPRTISDFVENFNDPERGEEFKHKFRNLLTVSFRVQYRLRQCIQMPCRALTAALRVKLRLSLKSTKERTSHILNTPNRKQPLPARAVTKSTVVARFSVKRYDF